jgi:hypothetical protein
MLRAPEQSLKLRPHKSVRLANRLVKRCWIERGYFLQNLLMDAIEK